MVWVQEVRLIGDGCGTGAFHVAIAPTCHQSAKISQLSVYLCIYVSIYHFPYCNSTFFLKVRTSTCYHTLMPHSSKPNRNLWIPRGRLILLKLLGKA
jgi:hypothetical protein